jgi:hypothetical protein
MRTVLLTGAALGLFQLYWMSFIYGTSVAFLWLPAPWWDAMFSTRGNAALTWMILRHTIAAALVSLPFACVLRLLYGRHGPTVALAITLVIVLTAVPQLTSTFAHDSIRYKLVTCFDLLKLIGFLPLLTWAIWKLPTNNRIERHVSDKVPNLSVSARGAHAPR